MTEFTVLGQPPTKGSTVSFHGDHGRIVTKTDSAGLRQWTRDVGWTARAARAPMLKAGTPVQLQVTFYVRSPKKLREWPTVRPDVDKMLRALLDALTGICYSDDAQVVSVYVVKDYSNLPRTVVRVGPLSIPVERTAG